MVILVLFVVLSIFGGVGVGVYVSFYVGVLRDFRFFFSIVIVVLEDWSFLNLKFIFFYLLWRDVVELLMYCVLLVDIVYLLLLVVCLIVRAVIFAEAYVVMILEMFLGEILRIMVSFLVKYVEIVLFLGSVIFIFVVVDGKVISSTAVMKSSSETSWLVLIFCSLMSFCVVFYVVLK